MSLWRIFLISAALFFTFNINAEGPRARDRQYAGGRDEEDLKVQNPLPDVVRRTDELSIQKEVYKTLFKQELKDDGATDESPASDL